MSIKKFIFYDIGRDEIVGYHHTVSGKKPIPAKNALSCYGQGN